MFESLTRRLQSAVETLRGVRRLDEENVAEGLRSVRQALLEADVHYKVAGDLVERVRGACLGEQAMAGVDPSQQFIHAVHAALVEVMGPEGGRLTTAKTPPSVILLAGLQGAGKTTTAAKLAKHLATKQGRRPLLVAADTRRPAAVEQLKVLGERIGVPVFHLPDRTPAQLTTLALEEARTSGRDVVLIDTAGRLHVDQEMMDEVAAVAEKARPDDTLLVVDAMTGQDAVTSSEAFHARLALTGVILTKMDGDARGGAALSLKAVTGCPVLFIGAGEGIDDLDPFQPERMAGRILGMGDVVGLVEKASEQIDSAEAQDSFERMVKGSFTMEDMLAQLRMVRRMGPMKKVLGMMPGMGSMLDQVDLDDRRFDRLEALCLSMTPRERIQPEVLDAGRRRRIASGAGQGVGAVNDLLKSFKSMRKVMKQMNKTGMGARMGMKGKKAALKGLSAPGAGAAMDGLLGGQGGLGAGGAMPDLGGLLGGMGGGAGGGLPGQAATGGLPGRSATRKSGKDRKRKQKGKRRGKGGRRR